jgi:hypothetical protein
MVCRSRQRHPHPPSHSQTSHSWSDGSSGNGPASLRAWGWDLSPFLPATTVSPLGSDESCGGDGDDGDYHDHENHDDNVMMLNHIPFLVTRRTPTHLPPTARPDCWGRKGRNIGQAWCMMMMMPAPHQDGKGSVELRKHTLSAAALFVANETIRGCLVRLGHLDRRRRRRGSNLRKRGRARLLR